MKYLSTLLLTLTICSSAVSQTQKDSIKHKAIEYIKAYGDWDFEKMKTFYADSITFSDPTASKAFKVHFSATGKENVYTFFKNIFKGQFENNKPKYVKFRINKSFQSDNFVILNTTFESILPITWFKENSNEKVLISMPFVTILEFENNKIIKHTDYGNYTIYKEQINVQIR
jgi:hypothetical protein